MKHLHRLTPVTKGISLIECSLLLAISTLMIAGALTMFQSAVKNQVAEVILEPMETQLQTAQIDFDKISDPSARAAAALQHANAVHEAKQSGTALNEQEIRKKVERTVEAVAEIKLSKARAMAQTPTPAKKQIQEVATAATVSGPWQATVTDQEVTLSLRTGASYATIHWGDGSSDNVYANGSFSGSHAYSSEGPHTIRIEGGDFKVISHSAKPGV